MNPISFIPVSKTLTNIRHSQVSLNISITENRNTYRRHPVDTLERGK
jgi:hypothetical protein